MSATEIAATIATTATFAAVPWLLAQPATRWAPNTRTKKAKRDYRRATAVLAIAATLPFAWGWPLPWVLATVTAITLTARAATYPRRQARAKAKADALGHVRLEDL